MSQIQFFADNINIYNNLNVDSGSATCVLLLVLMVFGVKTFNAFPQKKSQMYASLRTTLTHT